MVKGAAAPAGRPFPLRLQPGGLESLFPGEEGLDPHSSRIAHSPDEAHLLDDRGGAPLDPPALLAQRHDPIAEIDRLLQVEAILVEILDPNAGQLAQPLIPV